MVSIYKWRNKWVNRFYKRLSISQPIKGRTRIQIQGSLTSSEVKWRGSCSAMSDSLWPDRLYSPWNSPGQNTGVGSLSLLQWIFPTLGFNPGLLYCRWVLYQLSHQRSPRILEWVVYPFLTQESNRGLLHCRRILYQLSYQGSPS